MAVEKVLEVVEPAKELARIESIQPSLFDLFTTIRPTTEEVTNKSPSLAPKILLPNTVNPILPAELFKPIVGDKVVKLGGNPDEIEIFESNRLISPSESQNTEKPAQSSAPTSSPTTGSFQEVSSITTISPVGPFRSFLRRADDFIERNLNFKKFLA